MTPGVKPFLSVPAIVLGFIFLDKGGRREGRQHAELTAHTFRARWQYYSVALFFSSHVSFVPAIAPILPALKMMSVKVTGLIIREAQKRVDCIG